VRWVIAALLALEGLSTGVAVVSRVQALAIYPPLTVALILARAGIGIAQFGSAWMLVTNQDAGRVFARVVLLTSACLVTLELGLDLAPSNLFPAYHRPAVIAYWIYALAAAVSLRTRSDGR
jgi:hypothetical protein